MKSILVVDDSNATKSFIKSSIYEIDDVNIFEASSGFEALKLLSQHPFDMIITDINMPDINGFEFVTFIKNNDRYKDVPVVFISTERSKEDIEKGMSLGAASYLTKPFKSEELQAVVRKTLSL
ncbi:MAG: response regulator [Thermodesulfovibrionia bacterium]|nr:response regulator [Thermodesulfovibrionia bacterium]